LIAEGLARYGYKDQVVRLASSLHDVSTFMDLHRLPELFCGFHKRRGVEGPTLYPVACSPQAWSAGSPFMFLSACLGLSVSVPEKIVRFSAPHLPDMLNQLKLSGLRVGDAVVDLLVSRASNRTEVEAVGGATDVRVEVSA